MSVTDFAATPTDGGVSQDTGSGSDQPTEQAQTAAPAQTQPTERMFRQAEVDSIVRDRLARERQKYERQSPPQQQVPNDPIEARLAPYLGQIEDLALESRISRIAKQYPDFAQNENAVLEHALSIVQDNPAWASHPKLLEMAYRDWKYDQLQSVDVESIKKQAAEEAVKNYRGQKEVQVATTPKVEGKGGGTPTTAPSKVTWKNADELAKRLISQNRQHQG